jgi:hypothetical protein
MPIYTFENTKTGETEDQMISFDEMETYLKKNKHMRRVYKPVPIVDPVGIGITKPPVDFQKHVLGKIKAANPGSEAIASKRWCIPKEI